MTAQLIGAIILWLIVAIVAIAIVVYLVNWLYRRSSKEVSFVRTGLFGEKVVINGGAFVLPIIHDVTSVNMNVLRMAVTRANDEALITRDRMRVDIDAEFYVRVRPQREAVSVAAATLGRRTLQPDQLDTLLSGRLVSALRSIASEIVDDGVSISTVYMPLVRTPMIEPTGFYENVPAISPDEAATMIAKAIVNRPKKQSTTTGRLAEIAYGTAPKVQDAVVNAAYKLTPGSGGRRDGDGD